MCLNILCELDLEMGPTGLYSAARQRRAKLIHSGEGRGGSTMPANSPNEA